jgi:hypothetical protein
MINMFGIMNLKTGKCWASQGLWYRDDLDQYLYRISNSDVIAVPIDYVNTHIVRLPEEYHPRNELGRLYEI